MIFVGRALLGIAVAGIMTSGTTLIADYFRGEERAKLLGLQTGIMSLGGTVLITLVGLLTDIQWNTPFLIHLAALAVLPFVVIYLREPRPIERCPDDHPPVGEPGACAGESHMQESSTVAPSLSSKAVPIK